MLLTCINPIQDIIRTPLPQLEDLAKGAPIQLEAAVMRGTHLTQELQVALRAAHTQRDWFHDNLANCELSLALNAHLGAKRSHNTRAGV